MINVKGTKNALPEMNTSQRYVLKDGDEASRKPLIVGGLLMGVAAYLASIFAWGRDDESQSPLLQPTNPNATATEMESQLGIDNQVASPRTSPDQPDAETPSAVIPSVATIPQSMPLRYAGEGEGVPVVAASRNAVAERIDRVDAVKQPADLANSAGYRPSLGGDGSSSGKSTLDDDTLTGGSGSTHDGGSTDGDPTEPESDDHVCIQPDDSPDSRVSCPGNLLDVAPCTAALSNCADEIDGAGGEEVFDGMGGDWVVALDADDDVFEFASACDESPIAVSHVTMDFGVGDRIRMSEYDMFWKADHEADDRFEQIYHGSDEGDLPIRYRHDRDDGSEWAVVETDFEGDEMLAMDVSLKEIHKLSWSTERDDGHEWLS